MAPTHTVEHMVSPAADVTAWRNFDATSRYRPTPIAGYHCKAAADGPGVTQHGALHFGQTKVGPSHQEMGVPAHQTSSSAQRAAGPSPARRLT